jgi:sugar phosphate isomerase/epimerase
MIIEGKEDWEYGIHLLRDHIANVHIKNVSWVRERSEWKWKWDGLANGMVDWSQLLSLLARSGYTGMFALEDFRVPSNFDGAFAHLQRLRQETCSMMCQSGRCEAA